MKIKKIKWKDHPILGNLELDFANSSGVPYQNILLAGENGTGKTSILKSINGFLNGQALGNIEFIEYVINSALYKITSPVANVSTVPGRPSPRPNSYVIYKPDGSTEIVDNGMGSIGVNTTNQSDARYYGSVFSKARADFQTSQINSITSQTIDEKKSDEDKEENFSPLKQLLVDIDSQDNDDYTAKNRALGSGSLPYDSYYPNSKTFRFKNAFNNFFENIKYDGVSPGAKGKQIIFKKGASSVSIDDLSTGEKQIVFRGTYLLRNSNRLENANILIDEPELSMHPKWQRKVLQYYKQLFTKSGIQIAQLFFATHSDHVLKEALQDNTQNLVIALTTASAGVIAAKRIDAPFVLPTVTSAETSYLAFDLLSNDYHIELYGYLQEKLGGKNVKDTDTVIQRSSFYNASIHEKLYNHPNGSTVYKALPTYIRNCIDHPDSTRTYSEQELRTSVELLVKIIPAIP